MRRRGGVVECGRGASFQVERAAALRWRGGGAPKTYRRGRAGASRRRRFGGGVGGGGVEDALRWTTGRRRWMIVGGGDGGVEDRGRREGRQWKGEVRKKREQDTPFILSSLWHRVKTPPDAKKVLRHRLEDHTVPMESHRHRVEISHGAKSLNGRKMKRA